MENSKLSENALHNSEFMAQSNKIDDLERENRKLVSEIEYLKYAIAFDYSLNKLNVNALG